MTSADADFTGHPNGEWAALDGVPAQVSLAFDLANSRDERRFHPHSRRTEGRDLLATTDDLEGWLRYRGLVVGPLTDTELHLLWRMREVVRLLARANTDPTGRDGAREALDGVSDELPMRLAMDEEGRIALLGVNPGLRAVLAGILATAVEPASADAWSRLKMCAAADCRWVFYDRSIPRSGRWCAMAVCGNREKTRQYRRRQPLRGPGVAPGAG